MPAGMNLPAAASQASKVVYLPFWAGASNTDSVLGRFLQDGVLGVLTQRPNVLESEFEIH
jgi:hypothetical protein